MRQVTRGPNLAEARGYVKGHVVQSSARNAQSYVAARRLGGTLTGF